MGKIVEVVQASTSSQTQDESESATFSYFAFCWSNAAARAKAKRNAPCQNARKSKAKGVPGGHADFPGRPKIEAQTLQNAFRRPVGQPKAVASRSGTLCMGTLPKRPMTRPGGSMGALEASRVAPTESEEPPGTHRKAAETR